MALPKDQRDKPQFSISNDDHISDTTNTTQLISNEFYAISEIETECCVEIETDNDNGGWCKQTQKNPNECTWQITKLPENDRHSIQNKQIGSRFDHWLSFGWKNQSVGIYSSISQRSEWQIIRQTENDMFFKLECYYENKSQGWLTYDKNDNDHWNKLCDNENDASVYRLFTNIAKPIDNNDEADKDWETVDDSKYDENQFNKIQKEYKRELKAMKQDSDNTENDTTSIAIKEQRDKPISNDDHTKKYKRMHSKQAQHSCSCVYNNDKPGTGHNQGMIDSKTAWSAGRSYRYQSTNRWYQIDALKRMWIHGVLCQGREDDDQWVTTLRVSYSNDGHDFVAFANVFNANFDRTTKIEIIFDDPIHARYIRIHPQTRHVHISMRVDLLLALADIQTLQSNGDDYDDEGKDDCKVADNDDTKMDYHDKYTKTRNIGQGSFGKVVCAKTKKTGELVAIKIVPIKNVKNIDDIYNEIIILSESSKCKYVVSYIGSQHMEQTNEFWIVMEFCGGGSVQEMIEIQPQGIDNIEIRNCLRHILRGLVYLHDKCRMIHRDIKPANILIGKSGVYKIADFGTSKTLLSDLTDTMNKGSPFYMAPEAANPQRGGYSVKVDIWSIGITIIHMRTANFPRSYLDNKNNFAFYLGGMFDNFVAPRLSSQVYDNDLCNFIELCLQIDPSKRWTAKQLLSHKFITGN